MTDYDHVKFKPPRGLVPSLAEELGLASRWRRLGAALIDGLLLFLIGLAFSRLTYGEWLGKPASITMGRKLVMLSWGVVNYVAVNGYYLQMAGQTVGKKLLGIQIVRRNGDRATLDRLVVYRALPGYAATLIPVIGEIWSLLDPLFIFRTDRRCIHDFIADTIVVDVARGETSLGEPQPGAG